MNTWEGFIIAVAVVSIPVVSGIACVLLYRVARSIQADLKQVTTELLAGVMASKETPDAARIHHLLRNLKGGTTLNVPQPPPVPSRRPVEGEPIETGVLVTHGG